MSATEWPPKLKEWVAECLHQMTDSNRVEAQTEMRQVIADSYAGKSLWTMDWPTVKLKSLQAKPTFSFNNLSTSLNGIHGNSNGHLKRKTNDTPMASPKKAKKSALAKSATIVDLNDHTVLNRRAQRFQREHDIERQKISGSLKASHSAPSLHHRTPVSFTSDPNDDPEVNPNVPNWDRFTIVGTSTEVFKDYLRLTSEPRPDQIRPYPILQQTLTELKNKWRIKAPYNWVCSQFKSLRQDLTVQRIKNEFTVTVYEMHARMALEVDDLVEYNACLGQLKLLYDSGLPGNVSEFTAYRILLLVHGLNRSELNLLVAQLTPVQKGDEAIRHALSVQQALSMGNYHRFFRLYVGAPNMGAYVMDHFVDRERSKALIIMSRSYQRLPISFLATELAFDHATHAVEFLNEHNIAFFSNVNAPDAEKVLECRQIHDPLQQAFETKYRKVVIKGRV